MSQKPNDILNRKDQLIDSSKALRYSYNADEKSLDVITHGSPNIPKKYDRHVITYVDHFITSVSYYADNVVEKSEIVFTDNVEAGEYCTFYSGRDKKQFVIWYKVSGVGSAPTVSGATLIEVDVLNGDLAAVICLATKNALEVLANAGFYYRLEYCSGSINLNIINKQGGATTQTSDIDTGFTFNQKQIGSSELVGILDITYDDGDVTEVSGYSEELRD